MLLQRPAAEESDGRQIRRATRGDVGRLRDMLARCSVDTIYERFHTPYSVVPGWMPDLMVGVDASEGEAFVALAGEDIVGHAMYVARDEREAEIAVLVEDAWQSNGVGGRLLSGAAEHARLRGFEAFVCETLTENPRVPGLSTAVFSEVERRVEGATSQIRVPLRSLKTGRRAR
jgi:N-acetylglutamate synthase-like GNAT family acetyltransferase